MKKDEQIDVIVIGGGASGMMAAIAAAQNGAKVLILEKNKVLGNKLSITGGGRCNITNTNPDHKDFLSNYGAMSKFLHSPFSLYGVPETITFFKSIGIDIVTEARFRAFPSTHKATDVTDALKKEIKKCGIAIRTGITIKKIEVKKNKIVRVIARDDEYTAKTYILATGGMSHPETGSTGDGFGFLKEMGHTVHTPSPSIVPLAVSDKWVKNLSGVSIENMKISFFVDGTPAFKKTGKILFTHFGLSGPLILNLSQKVGDLLHTGVVTATINLYPDLDEAGVSKKIISLFDSNKNKIFKNVIKDIAPQGMDGTIVTLSEIDPEKKVHSITKEERKKLEQTVRALHVSITGLMGYDRAVIADGGVDISEIEMKTMKSKIISNLAVTGDLLHIHRPSGGYSLQLCWTTGYLAGKNMV
jgi:predicted Rossmann fold flavoprotein